jgi:heme/copper-type cytochrome/quinol oxidase subunit 3
MAWGWSGSGVVPAMRRYLNAGLDLRGWAMIVLMAAWMLLNVFDLLITYDGLATGVAYEANRFLSRAISIPAVGVTVKLSLAYAVLKLVERIEARTPYSGLAPLLAANVYLSWACLHNLHVISGVQDWSHFLRYYPLTGLPR